MANLGKRGKARNFLPAALISILLIAMIIAPAMATGFPLSQGDARIQAALDFLRDSEAQYPALWVAGEKACYAIVAIEACGGDAHTFTNTEGKSLVDIIRDGVPTYLKPQPTASLAHEYYLFAIVAAGEDPRNFGGVDVVQQLKDMFDGSQIGQSGIINDDFWAIITLVGAGEDPNSTIIQTSKNHILANQSADGGWGCVASGGGGMGSDPCDTSNAIMALRAAGESPWSQAIQDGLAYIKSTQRDDGGFPYMAGYGSDSGTDGRVIAALRCCGIDPTSPAWTKNGHNAVEHALSLQQPDGGFAWHSGGSTDAWMTTYIMPALVGKHWPPDLFVGKIPAADTSAPTISALNPPSSASVNIAMPTISAGYSDSISGIDTSSVVLKVDGMDIISNATVTGSNVSYNPGVALTNGAHSVHLSVSDHAGNQAVKTWNFTVDTSAPPDEPTPEPGDTTPPTVSSVKPQSRTTINTGTPTISAGYSDTGSGIDISSVVLKVNGKDVTSEADVGNSSISYIPETALANGTYTIDLKVSDVSGNQARYAWNFIVSASATSDAAGNTSQDTTPPMITNPVPQPQSSMDGGKPEVGATYSDAISGIDVSSVILKVDGRDVTSKATVGETGVSYTPETPLADGEHRIDLSVSDEKGNQRSQAWSFHIKTEVVDLAGKIDANGKITKSLKITSGDGKAILNISQGVMALTSDSQSLAQMSLRRSTDSPSLPPEHRPIGPIYNLEPDGATFDPPATLTLHYDEISVSDDVSAWDVTGDGIVNIQDIAIIGTPDREVMTEENFRIACFDSGEWMVLENSVVNATENTVTANICLFTYFTIVCKAAESLTSPEVDLPIAIDQISPSGATITDETDSSGLITEAAVFASENGMASLQIPAGTTALNGQGIALEQVAIAPVDDSAMLPDDLCRVGPAYDLGPEGATFDPLITLTLHYEETVLSEVIRWDTNGDGKLDLLDDSSVTAPEDFKIACFEGGAWVVMENSVVNRDDKTVIAEVSHFTRFAILGGAAKPLIVKRMETTPENASLGEETVITAIVENPGKGRGTYILPLKIDGVLEYEKEVTLLPGENEVSFSHTEPYAGTHEVEMKGQKAEFAIGKAESSGSKWWNSVDVVFNGYIGIAAICIAVMLGVIILALLRRRRSEAK